MSDTVQRFSNRVENYVKYRPRYPGEVLQLFKDKMGLTAKSVLADIGSGPGISAQQFFENGNIVYCVEPNDVMRRAAEFTFGELPNFKSVNGKAEATTLADHSVDFVVASQAFHWFDPRPTRAEFGRILRSGGHIVLIWNERQLDSTPFLIEYEQFIIRHAKDYAVVRHENIHAEQLTDFLGDDMNTASFENMQLFDFDGLRGRLLSSSYIPAAGEKGHALMIDELQALFAKHAESGKIKVLYDTKVYYKKH
jgi:SAM-dependent methyltransferase